MANKYIMEKTDKTTYKAVMFACNLMKQGKRPYEACRIASSYYKVDRDEVHRLVSQRGGRKAK